jgi:hypothetical protein
VESRPPTTFTREEAEALLPSVDQLLAEAQVLAERLSGAEGDHQTAQWKPRVNGKVPSETTAVGTEAARRESATQLAALIERLQGMGIVVRDVRSGLIDFPCVRDGRVIHLCWRRGEPLRIRWWHEVDTGFAGRQLL